MFNLWHCICLRSEGLFSKLFNLFTLFYFKLIFKMKTQTRNKEKLSIKHLEIFLESFEMFKDFQNYFCSFFFFLTKPPH